MAASTRQQGSASMMCRLMPARTAVLLLGFVVLVFLGGLFRIRSGPWLPRPAGIGRATADLSLEAADAARPVPLRIGPRARHALDLGPEDRARVSRQIRPFDRQHNMLSLCLHVLRVHGLSARFAEGDLPSSEAILELLTSEEASRKYFGHPAMIRTRSGVRYPTAGVVMAPSSGWESHRDQVLAAFGELGIPLTQPLRFPDATLSVRDVLQDSLANYQADQGELMWTGLAYALYLPPSRSWLNRFGERTTFDDLASELLARPLNRSPCAGTHLIYTLTVLGRADQQEPVLTGAVRERLWQRLRQARDAALATQEPDGSWPLDWNRALLADTEQKQQAPDITDPDSRLLTTGHLAEWLLYLPEELAVPESCLRQAGWWLYERLRVASPDQVRDNFCPYAHAARVLLLTSTPEGPSHASAEGK
jgi:hypothetical protein